MKFFLASIAALLLSACSSTLPTAASMDQYYREAEAQCNRDIERLREKVVVGEITQEEFNIRAQTVRDSIGRRASQMAWARHELVEAQKRSMGVPTGDTPVPIAVSGKSGDSFYRQAGQSGGAGYQGLGGGGSNMWHGYTPGTMAGSLGAYSQ